MKISYFILGLVVSVSLGGKGLGADERLIEQFLEQISETVNDFPSIEFEIIASRKITDAGNNLDDLNDLFTGGSLTKEEQKNYAERVQTFDMVAKLVMYQDNFHAHMSYRPELFFPTIFQASWDGKMLQDYQGDDKGDYYLGRSRNRSSRMTALYGIPNPFAALEVFFPNEERDVLLWPIPEAVRPFLSGKPNYTVEKIIPSSQLLGQKGILLEMSCKSAEGNRVEYQILYGDLSSRFPKAMVKKYIADEQREEIIFSGDASEKGGDLKGWMPGTISQRSFLEGDILIAETLARVRNLKRVQGIDDNLLAIIEPLNARLLVDMDNNIAFFLKLKKMQKVSNNEDGKMKIESGPISIKSDGTIILEDGSVIDIFSNSKIRQ